MRAEPIIRIVRILLFTAAFGGLVQRSHAGPDFNPTITKITVHHARLIQLDFSQYFQGNALNPSWYTIAGSGQGTLAAHPDVVEGVDSSSTFSSVYLKWNSGTMVNGGDIVITISRSLLDYGGLPFVRPYNEITAFGGGVEHLGAMHVDPVNGSDANTGQDWGHAKRSVQAAIDTISRGEVWLKQGTYGGVLDLNRAAFRLKSNVAVYGGFSGTEQARPERSTDPSQTVLDGSGDAWHVVYIGPAVSGAVLDGLTITGGHSPDAGQDRDLKGAGIYDEASASNMVNNCVILGNTARTQGGGVYGKKVSMTNCRIEKNKSLGWGGGIAGLDKIQYSFLLDNIAEGNGGGGADEVQSIMDSVFLNNTAKFGGGASRCSYFNNCTFVGNVATDGGGGGIDPGGVYGQGILQCHFFNNTAAQFGGGAFVAEESVLNCEFAGNTALRGGGVYVVNGFKTSEITLCRFYGNRALSGAGLWMELSNVASPSVKRCTFTGNVAASQGGGLFLHDPAPLANCIIAGNEAGLSGGGIHFAGTLRMPVSNCTIDRNLAPGGGAFSTAGEFTTWGYEAARPAFSNCIITNNALHASLQLPGMAGQANTPNTITACLFFGNTGGHYRLPEEDLTVENAADLNTLYFCRQNKDGDPLYRMDTVDSGSGTWSSVTYDPNTNDTTLVDVAGTIGAADSLVGKAITPNTLRPFQAVVLKNTANSITVSGDLVSENRAVAGDGWRLIDYHLSAGSPAIDSGINNANSTDIDNATRPKGAGYDIGAYEYVP